MRTAGPNSKWNGEGFSLILKNARPVEVSADKKTLFHLPTLLFLIAHTLD